MWDDFPVISEIKTEYKEKRAGGSGREEAVQELMESYRNELSADDDSLLFWIALADAQIACKELSADIADKGLKALAALEKSEMAWLFGEKQIEKRKVLYSQPPMPERDKIRIRKKFQCKWNIGDTFAYRFKGENAEKYHLLGKTILVRKVDETTDMGEIHPIVTLTLWDKAALPKTYEEFCAVQPLKLDSGRLGSRRCCQYEYRVEILFTSNRQVDNLQLEYIGNFPKVESFADEVIFQRPGEILMALPYEFDDECCLFYRKDRFFKTGIID